MTNDKTSQCGIYELPIQKICMETGYDRKTVMELLDKFISFNKIIYSEDTSEIMILNWFKYNEPNNPNAVKCVNKELKGVKNKFMIRTLYEQCVTLKLEVNNIFHEVYIEMEEVKTSSNEFFCTNIIPLQENSKPSM